MYTVLLDTDIPLSDFTPTFESLQERLDVAVASLDALGAQVTPTEDEKRTALGVFTGSTPATNNTLAIPGVVAQVAVLLSEYDKMVVQSAAQLRTYITNRLVLDSDNKDPRIRLKALEMLGKISDVGLFTEKTEVTMRHRSTDELEQMLRERLTTVVEDAVFLPTQPHDAGTAHAHAPHIPPPPEDDTSYVLP